MNSTRAGRAFFRSAGVLAVLILLIGASSSAQQAGATTGAGQSTSNVDYDGNICVSSATGSAFIPVDSWVYPAVMRLYSLGYIDSVFLGLRPWTRLSINRMLDEASDRIDDTDSQGVSGAGEAEALYKALREELRDDPKSDSCVPGRGFARAETVYSVVRGISGTPLRDSFHLGSTIVNDYGRPFEAGFNNYTGASGYASHGPFAAYVRAEFQGSPSGTGYSAALANALSTVDRTTFLNAMTGVPYIQTTIPMGPIAAATRVRFLEAYVSAQYLNHVFSFGKQDAWMGPGLGGGMAYSNNADNIYSFRINRIEPMDIPLLSRLTGPFRYDFLIGQLRGHTEMPPSADNFEFVNPGNPWVHVEKISFRPTANLEFGWERTVIWGGKGHDPITLHSFLKSFFSTVNVTNVEKASRDDPGARFASFDFSYRLPFLRNWLTLYTDSEVHDDVSPVDAPRHAGYRPGLYLSHVPGLPKLDVRVEAASTDPTGGTTYSKRYGQYMYWEGIQRQGYTNQGQLFGDWIGREDKGGQGWITYHLSGNEWVQLGYRNQKAAKYFIPGSTSQTFSGPTCVYTSCLLEGGTTLNDVNLQVVKRVRKDLEVNGNFAFEHWKAPIYLPGQHTVTTTTIQLKWYPERKVDF